jgi:hypothetical protein
VKKGWRKKKEREKGTGACKAQNITAAVQCTAPLPLPERFIESQQILATSLGN